jgi:hypothetical protein
MRDNKDKEGEGDRGEKYSILCWLNYSRSFLICKNKPESRDYLISVTCSSQLSVLGLSYN